MAASAPGMGAGSLRVNLYDGTRQPVPADLSVLLRVIDGNQKQLVSSFVEGPHIRIPSLPFHDNFGDLYRVLANAKGYRDTGQYPVHIVTQQEVTADLMLLPENGGFQFDPLSTLEISHPAIHRLLSNGLTDSQLQDKFNNAKEKSQQLGALLNICTAMESISLPDGGASRRPLDFYWQLEWDLLAPDRFWAWVDPSLVSAMSNAADLGIFAKEPNPKQFHAGLPPQPGFPAGIGPATKSCKEIRFDVANVQLTFHENDTKTIALPDGFGGTRNVDCVMAEPDIDYYKDPAAHGLLEVLPNLLTKGKTDPQVVYMLRWMATRQEGLPDFAPPCTIS